MKELHDAAYIKANNSTDGSQKSSLLEVSSQQHSMESLVVWNISKALERNRVLDFQEAIKELQKTMELSSRELNTAVFAQPQERHLACALLAWQQLHRSTESLIQFAESKREKLLNATAEEVKSQITSRESSDEFDTASILQKQSFVMGPVVALPIHTKVVMRVERTPSSNKPKSSTSSAPQRVIKKLEAAGGCVELGCVAKLKELDRGTSELRARASKLSRREAERAELLERAEMAWRELEGGFQRRLCIADEKEEQYATRIESLVEERKEHKQTCMDLIALVEEKAEALEKRKEIMHKCEEEVCGLACLCHQLNEEVLKVDSALAQATAKFHQLDRECQLKEEQAQRRVKTLKSQVEAAQQFTVEAELTLRSELGALKDQIETVSAELLDKDNKNEQLSAELEQLNTVKMTLVDDLEACNRACDRGLQAKLAELKEKTEHLSNAREQALKCTCHAPVEASVEARRTPSLAALCCCPAGGMRDEDECSCTSLRTKLLNDLVAELFGGLRTELSEALYTLPCQMLKCLEDKHNWDKASALKTNLQVYFSKLLVDELDIAIATSIERYHVKWIGGTCADKPSLQGERRSSLSRPVPSSQGRISGECGCWGSDMKQRVEELANQMFDRRVNELQLGKTSLVTSDGSHNRSTLESSKRHSLDSSNKSPDSNRHSYESSHKNSVARESRISRGSEERDPSVLYCQVPRQRKSVKEEDILPAFLKRTHNDVNQIRAQIEDLKKDTLKKTDLKTMEEKILKLLQTSARPESPTTNAFNEDLKESFSPKLKYPKNFSLESTIKVHNYRNIHADRNIHIDNPPRNFIDMNKNMLNYKKRPIKDFSPPKRFSKLSVYGSGQFTKTPQKVFKNPSYAVNMCLCPEHKEPLVTIPFRQDIIQVQNMNVADSPPRWARTLSPDENPNKDDLETALQFELELLKDSEIPQPNKEIPRHENSLENVNASTPAFLKASTSVDRLLSVLCQWKKDLNTSQAMNENNLELFRNQITILKTSESKLDSNLCNIQSLKKKCLHSSYRASAQSTNKFDSKKHNKSFIQNANKVNLQNYNNTNNLQLVNKAVDSPAQLNINMADMKDIPEITELSKISQHTYSKDLSIDSNKEFLLIISNSQQSLGHKTDFNKKDSKRSQLSLNSEYMGQISLNRSIKGTCKCATSYENRCKCADNNEDKTKLQYQNPSRGTEAYAIDFKDSVEQPKDNPITILSSQAEANKLTSSSKGEQSTNSYYSPIPVANFINTYEDQLHKMSNKSSESNKNITVLKQSEALSIDCDYNVKFLGVTLNNTNDEPDSESFLLNNLRYEEEKYNKTKTVENKTSGVLKSKLHASCIKSADQIASCHCHDKFEDLKQYFNNLLTNCKTIVANQDKSLDAQSFKDTKDFCVCCDDDKFPDDLEVNTFELIKDHLKSKLQDLKFSTCKFTCVPYEQEEKLLSSILIKVKQVISESTKHTCKCSGTYTTQGNWNRAYALLQEYFKTKIKRVQCVCGSPSVSEENVLLPDLLDKVCHLIENDFDRIKNICRPNETEKIPVKEKNLKNPNSSVMVHRVDVISTILPDFDQNQKACKEVSKQSFFKNHKQISKQSFQKTETMSSQVSKTFSDNLKCDIGSSCQQFEEITAEEHKIKRGNGTLENQEEAPVQEKPELARALKDMQKAVTYQPLISCDNAINEQAVSDIDTKSENKILIEHYLGVNPYISDTRCTCDRNDSNTQKSCKKIKVFEKTPSHHIIFKDCVCDKHTGVNTIFNDDITLKYKDPNFNQSRGACATYTREKSCDPHQRRCLANSKSNMYDEDTDPPVHLHDHPGFQEKVLNAKSEMFSNVPYTNSSHPTCDCSLIPLCHVKMLVENIEDKLANSKCTCDSFSSNVCPIHSKLKSC